MPIAPDDLVFWRSAVQKALPSWLKTQDSYNIIQKDGSIDPTVLANALSFVIATIDTDNSQNSLSCFLANMTGSDLDFFGFSRQVFRKDGEEDDPYRERIRKFWIPPSSSSLISALKSKFPDVYWIVFEVPYNLGVLVPLSAVDSGREEYACYVGRNSVLISDSVDFPLVSRKMFNAIIVYGEGLNLPTQSEVTDVIYQLYKQDVAFGVAVYTALLERDHSLI